MVTAGLLWGLPALAQVKVPPAEEFATKVAMSDMMEIQAAELALARQPDADTKPFAERRSKIAAKHHRSSKLS